MPGCRSKVSPLAQFTRPSALWTRQQLYSDAEQNIRDKAARKTSSRLDFTRTLRLRIDLWWERKATQQPEQIALTCAARQKITFKNGQCGLASSCAAAFTRPGSTERSLPRSTIVLVGMAWCTFPFFSFNWKPLPTESSRGRCLCSMQQLKFLVSELGEDLSNLKCVTTVFTECISATLRQHVFVVVNPSFHFHTVHTKHFDATLLLMYLYLTSCCFILIKCRHD